MVTVYDDDCRFCVMADCFSVWKKAKYDDGVPVPKIVQIERIMDITKI